MNKRAILSLCVLIATLLTSAVPAQSLTLPTRSPTSPRSSVASPAFLTRTAIEPLDLLEPHTPLRSRGAEHASLATRAPNFTAEAYAPLAHASVTQAGLTFHSAVSTASREEIYKPPSAIVPHAGVSPAVDIPAATCTVDTTADSGAGSLRQCLASAGPGDTINFNPAVFPPASPVTITVALTLPQIIMNGLLIDGSSAGVVLDGSALITGTGLIVNGASNVIIRGLWILNFPKDGIELTGGASNAVIGGTTAAMRNILSGNGEAGVWINGTGTDNNQVLGNYIGTSATGNTPLSNTWGVFISDGAQNNTVGGAAANARNIISGNVYGVGIQDSGTMSNTVLGNYIGTNASGAAPLGNVRGVLIWQGAQNNTVGGTSAGARNLISGNEAGVRLRDAGTMSNTVIGNYIGVNASGASPISNTWGVYVLLGAQNNMIGGATAGARNLISGNTYGVQLESEGTSGNQVLGNYIGTNASGTLAVGNTSHGVVIGWGADANFVGGTAAGEGNLLSGNGYDGVLILHSGTTGNQVLGNAIGTTAAGMTALNNTWGVVIADNAQNNVIGGAAAGARNLISGNAEVGVWIQNDGTSGNQVLGNFIGTNAAGTAPVSNTWGVAVTNGAQNNLIGGTAAGARNLISGNANIGVTIENSGTNGNQVQGNYIGTNAAGTAPVSNTWGVAVTNGAQNNLIGGTAAGARNLISGNTEIGITIEDDGTAGNQVLGNYIGTNISGTLPLSNTAGVVIGWGADANIVGGTATGAGNLISGNVYAGVQIQGDPIIPSNRTTNNQVLGNIIGLDVTGAAPLGNMWGVDILAGAQDNTIGGTTANARNLISGNEFGVKFEDPGTSNNHIQGNYIGTNISGTLPLSNTTGVVIGWSASANFIGGTTPGAGNLISGNEFGVDIWGVGTNDNQVLGNLIGTTASGTAALGNIQVGVNISLGADNNRVGGTTANARNVISGNVYGVQIADAGTTNNTVLGNYIGTDISGIARLGNQVGVFILSGAQNNHIGEALPGAGNLISGNDFMGVLIQGNVITPNTQTTNNQVLGNHIGVNLTGMLPLSNTNGVVILGGAQGNTIGGSTPAARNLISGNDDVGIQIQNVGTISNTVLGNYIGVNLSGTAALGNGVGVAIIGGAQNNWIGSQISGTRNLISGNASAGIQLQDNGTSGNQVVGNYIGTDTSGVTRLGNLSGVAIFEGADGNVVGGETPGARNLISGNTYNGVEIYTNGTLSNTVLGNYIGTDISGLLPVSNTVGVAIALGAQNNTVGGTAPGAGNLISGNAEIGVVIDGDPTMIANPTTNNRVLGNIIGADATGTLPLGNGRGVVVSFGANDNIIGGEVEGARNLVSGNLTSGIQFQNTGTTGNQVLGNYIGTNISGTARLGNLNGVWIAGGPDDNVIGGLISGTRNIVSGNSNAGIWIQDSGTTGHQVLGNYIGVNASGTAPLSNTVGVVIASGADANMIGDGSAEAQNLISGNAEAGIRLQDAGTTNNTISHNAIMTNTVNGIYMLDGASSNTIGVSNTIAYNGQGNTGAIFGGVIISGATTAGNTITRNSIHSNGGRPIHLNPPSIAPPSLCYTPTVANSVLITGTVGPNDQVEIFSNLNSILAGTTFLDDALADIGGYFAITITLTLPPDQSFLSATTTTPAGTTSELQAVLNCGLVSFRLYLPLVSR